MLRDGFLNDFASQHVLCTVQYGAGKTKLSVPLTWPQSRKYDSSYFLFWISLKNLNKYASEEVKHLQESWVKPSFLLCTEEQP